MTPFIFQNSTVTVDLHAQSQSIITVEQQGEVFVTLQSASLSLRNVQFVFDELTTPAFLCDHYSSITLYQTAIKLTTPTLTQPFIDSVGRLVLFSSQLFLQPITLDHTPFIRLVRAEKDAIFSIYSTTTLLANPLATPFIVCVGARSTMMQNLTLNHHLVNSTSFAYFKDSKVNLVRNQIQLLSSTAQGTFLHLEDSEVRFQQDSCDSSSGHQGGLLYCRNSAVSSDRLVSSSCSATQGGVFFLVESSVKLSDGSFSNCEAQEGGVACLISSTLSISKTSFVSNSAKCGGVFWVDCGSVFTSTVLSSYYITFTSNSASDVNENGDDCGKGGAIFVKGTTTSQTPLNLTNFHFEGNTAAFGNDVYVEESVLGETGLDLLSGCGGESYSRLPHLEIENHNLDDDKLIMISNFVPFPSVRVSNYGKDNSTCKWSNAYCQTIRYALQSLHTTYPNGSLFQRRCIQNSSSMITDPIELEKHDLIYSCYGSSQYSHYKLSLSAAFEANEGVVFTINDVSRLTVDRIKFLLKSLHRVVTVTSKDGQLTMKNCFILSESDATTSISPIWSIGSSLVLNTVSFSPTLTTSTATLSAPLVHFAPKPSGLAELGSGSFELFDSIFTNLTFEGTTMIEVSTTGDVTFASQTLTNVASDQQSGNFLVLKGQHFKTQLKSELWDDKLKTTTHLISLFGEDISMDKDDKWRNNSLVYWLISPKEEILIDSDENAVDHPNCGSSTFKCTTLDSAISSAGLNTISTLSLSISTTLSSKSVATSSLLIKSSSSTKRGIEFDKNGSFVVADSSTNLSFTSIVFTVVETCVSTTLFVVEAGELSFSSCEMGGTHSESPLVLPESTTTLIEVTSVGKLTLTDTLIQHIKTMDRGSSKTIVLSDATAVLTRCSFTSLSSSSSGGAVTAELSSSNSLTITSCTFESCSSQGNGGSVSVVVSGGELVIHSSCTSSGDGKWVFVQGRDLASLVTKERWAKTFNSLSLRSDADKLWGVDLAEDESSRRHSISLLRFLIGNSSRIPVSTVFVGQNGKDEFGCGDTEAALCRTVEWSVKEAADSVVDIVVTSRGILSSPIVLLNSDILIAPSSDPQHR
ncbi:hypothetical protein BLNAU_19397 [Blattamonas nauphoetae]|uniref:Uncharacterized protein n=1 Tax=Blattamonas nauphoetae TaxID=2049346 RepID=A0ABQ9X230_9EUKA|nr:hypothetical protein BLNAU_19397 [Blattamonas nauphoetae]